MSFPQNSIVEGQAKGLSLFYLLTNERICSGKELIELFWLKQRIDKRFLWYYFPAFPLTTPSRRFLPSEMVLEEPFYDERKKGKKSSILLGDLNTNYIVQLFILLLTIALVVTQLGGEKV